MSLYDVARRITDEIIPPVELYKGGRFVHPKDGEIQIISGEYRDATYGRISNFWTWRVVATGKTRSGYGGYWPEVKL